MLDRKPDPKTGVTEVGAWQAKTRFAVLIARAEKGESFLVTKNGRPVARITPANIAPALAFDREMARRAAQHIRALAAEQGPRVSEEEAERNCEELKAEIERHRQARIDRWLKS